MNTSTTAKTTTEPTSMTHQSVAMSLASLPPGLIADWSLPPHPAMRSSVGASPANPSRNETR